MAKTKLSKLATVNVVEMKGGVLFSIRAFRDNPKGNEQAEAIFASLVKANDSSHDDDDIAQMLDDGNYDPGDGYELFLAHSDPSTELVEMPKERLFTA